MILRNDSTFDAWRGRRLPEPGRLAGYAALIEALSLQVPLPRVPTMISERHVVDEIDGWRVLTPRHSPDDTLADHLTFALKHEGVDLAVLSKVFESVGPRKIEALVEDTPTGAYARRIWYLYEWLMGERLELPDASGGRYVDVLDLQYGTTATSSARHRVNANLPGTPGFCPLVYRTDAIDSYVEKELSKLARQVVGEVPADILRRAAAFLLLEDSRSTFAIEGEQPSPDRIHRWGEAIAEAGSNPMDLTELARLQQVVLGDMRFVRPGLRVEPGFVGSHDRRTRAPIPVHIDARPEDLGDLMEGLFAFDESSEDLDPVIATACLAFGFVYIHPFEDGNGRLHRYLIHHMLAERDFHPPGVVFPVSSVILDRVDEYRDVLESYSKRLLPAIDWTGTEKGNVEVRNETATFYRFFDATPHVEFLFRCVERTIEHDLPREVEFLEAYDRFVDRVKEVVEMPDERIDLLFRFLRQNQGKLSSRATSREFSAFRDDEIDRIEGIFEDSFGRESE